MLNENVNDFWLNKKYSIIYNLNGSFIGNKSISLIEVVYEHLISLCFGEIVINYCRWRVREEGIVYRLFPLYYLIISADMLGNLNETWGVDGSPPTGTCFTRNKHVLLHQGRPSLLFGIVTLFTTTVYNATRSVDRNYILSGDSRNLRRGVYPLLGNHFRRQWSAKREARSTWKFISKNQFCSFVSESVREKKHEWGPLSQDKTFNFIFNWV